jgi:hypothetical protein
MNVINNELINIIKNPYEDLKQKCIECDQVFHINCALKFNLLHFEQTSLNGKKSYLCFSCHNQKESSQAYSIYNSIDSININNRVLRNTKYRKQW